MSFSARTRLACLGIGGLIAVTGTIPSGTLQAAAGAQAGSQAASEPRALVDQYCVVCHNERNKANAAGLSLAGLDLADAGTNGAVLETVVRRLRTGAMPPVGARRPEEARLSALAGWLEQNLDAHAAAHPDPGRPVARRLNRTEYTNAVRDLLGLEIDGRAMLPTDNSGHGFDNIGDVLTTSPALLERYLIAAQRISRLVVADSSVPPVAETHRVPFGMLQEARMSEDLPFGSRGGTAFTHYFPANGDYTIRIMMQRPSMNRGVRGEGRVNDVDLRIDGKRVQLFTIGGKAQRQGFYDQPEEIDQHLEVRVPIEAGEHLVSVSFQRANFRMEGLGPEHLPTTSTGYANSSHTGSANGRIEMGVDTVTITGPFDATAPATTASRERVFVCQPATAADEPACARAIASTLARRAYRRPVTDAEVSDLMEAFTAERAASGFDRGIRRVVERVLMSPNFLFRVESDPAGVTPGQPYPVSDLDLASRLSFFLWSSIPDDELLQLAADGKLRDPAVLDQQVRRMLTDERAQAIIDNFFGQWLFLRNVDLVRPDPKAFPEFDESLRTAFRTETELFLRSQIAENRSVLDLVTANYTFVNEQLAKHYDIPGVYGERFRRVEFTDTRRAGILGQGSLLTVTSYANRTSPVKRGQWLLENLLGTPPPAPPANVPPFPETREGEAPRSVRARMEQHRQNPVCASCHSRIDPLGFALENFNGVGKWRDTDANAPVDASGNFPNGSKFSGPGEFRSALLESNADAFLGTLTGKLLTFALGRGVEHTDMPAIRQILREARRDDYRWSSLVLAIVTSEPFQMRRAES
ncbi:MAG: DUF1592 domain-containing protein [Acidimicrobiia bacterium]|nr:DUF1592 domain-containing protein [Acidimicrobiia bacterium]